MDGYGPATRGEDRQLAAELLVRPADEVLEQGPHPRAGEDIWSARPPVLLGLPCEQRGQGRLLGDVEVERRRPELPVHAPLAGLEGLDQLLGGGATVLDVGVEAIADVHGG